MPKRNITNDLILTPNTAEQRAAATRFICRRAANADDAATIAAALGLDTDLDEIREQATQDAA